MEILDIVVLNIVSHNEREWMVLAVTPLSIGLLDRGYTITRVFNYVLFQK